MNVVITITINVIVLGQLLIWLKDNGQMPSTLFKKN